MGPDESALPTADAALQGSPRELELLLCTRLLLPPEPGGAGQLLPQQNCSRKPERHPGQLACQAGAAGIPPRRERLLCAEIRSALPQTELELFTSSQTQPNH